MHHDSFVIPSRNSQDSWLLLLSPPRQLNACGPLLSKKSFEDSGSGSFVVHLYVSVAVIKDS